MLFAAPTENQISAFWNYSKDMLSEAIAAKLIAKNETKHELIFGFSGGSIKAKTAWDADSLRGDYADLLILEEYAYMNPDAWEKVGAPMLLDNDGIAWFMSSPNRRNHFYRLYSRCNDSERYEAFHGVSMDNPHLSKEALAEIILDMTEDNYRQEILAEFLENSGSVFKNVDKATYSPADDYIIPKAHAGHIIVLGVDLGKVEDYTVISLVCATCKRELILYRSRQQRYLYQVERIKALRDRWHPDSTVVERNSMGEVVIEECQERDIDIQPFTTTAKSKQMIIENLTLELEKGNWKFLDNKEANAEMKAYESTLTKSGNIVYGAPSGLHDDIVMARAMAVFRAGRLV